MLLGSKIGMTPVYHHLQSKTLASTIIKMPYTPKIHTGISINAVSMVTIILPRVRSAYNNSRALRLKMQIIY